MSPLQIELLLRLYYTPHPFQGYSVEQQRAPATVEAFWMFSRQGLLRPGITHMRVVVCARGQEALPRDGVLTEKGQALVQRLLAVEP